MTSISAHEARTKFAEFVERAFYQNQKFQVKRNDKAMAWIVGEPFMIAVDQMVDYLITHEPAVADTLAIMLDDDLRQMIEQGNQEIKEGKTLPLESILDD